MSLKKARRRPRRIQPSPHQNVNNRTNYVESTILKIWCKKHDLDDEFYDALTKNDVDGLRKLQTLNRVKLRQLIKNLDWTTFKKPANEDELCKYLDKVDKDSPMGRYYGNDSDSSEEDELLSFGPPQPQMQMERAFAGGMNLKRGMKRKKKAVMRSSAMCKSAAVPKMAMSRKMDFDEDEMKLGFAVGGANDIQLFRDLIANNKMPHKTDISCEGIYNEYYFDTETRQKGQDIEDEQTEHKKTEEEADDDSKANEDEDDEADDDLPMFYPSYCYAKSRKPYALYMAESIKPKIITKKKKKPKTEEGKKAPTKSGDTASGLDDVWNKYVKQFGYKPKTSNAFYKWASDKSSTNISYKKATDYFNKHNPKKKQRLSKVVPPKPTEERYNFNDIFEDDPDDITFDVADEKTKEREIFMTVGLNSNIKQKDFERKKQNLLVLLDISGSMNKAFPKQDDKDSNYWGYNTKMQIACKAVLGLLTNLNHEDRFGLVTFNRTAQIWSNMCPISHVRVSFLRRIASNIYANGGTNFEQGYLKCIEVLKQVKQSEEYDNRIMILTDLRPNMGQKDPQKLMELVTKHAEDEQLTIFTTFVGIGLDFNSKLVSKLGKIKGANYYSVHSNAEFMKTMEKEFVYMVSPLVFNLKLTLKSEGDIASIDAVYGSNSDDLKNGEIMNIKSLFPSPPNESGETKGGIVLLRIKRKDNVEMDQNIFNMIVEVSFEDKYGKKNTNKQMVEFGGDNTLNTDDYYDNNGVQKGILLARFVDLVQEWMKHDRYYYSDNIRNVDVIKKHYWYSLMNRKNKSEQNIYISSKYKKIFRSFETYFIEESAKINDKELKREQDLVHKLCCYSDDEQ